MTCCNQRELKDNNNGFISFRTCTNGLKMSKVRQEINSVQRTLCAVARLWKSVSAEQDIDPLTSYSGQTSWKIY